MTDWINDSIREIIVAQPEANTVVGNVLLAAGTKQTLPAGAIALGRVNRNTGASGTTIGEAPRQSTLELMDRHKPSWHADTATAVVKNYMKPQHTPRTFYVWPPSTGAVNLEVEYSAVPTQLTTTGQTIGIDDHYVNAIVEYVLYRAFGKDSELAGTKALSQQHYEAFAQCLGNVNVGEAAEK